MCLRLNEPYEPFEYYSGKKGEGMMFDRIKLRWKAAIMLGILIIMAWMMNTDDKRVEYGERIESLNNLVKDYEVGQEIISNQQAGQIEIIRTQLAQVNPDGKN